MQADAQKKRPTVFISYAHESDELRVSVQALADWLGSHGCSVLTDHPYKDRPPDRGWPVWMHDCVRKADVVLVVCTPKLKARYEKNEEPGTGFGATFEGAIVTQHIYDAAMRTMKFFPIIPDAGSYDDVPDTLRPWWNHHNFPSGYEGIWRMITNEPLAPHLPDHTPQEGALPCKYVEALAKEIVSRSCLRELHHRNSLFDTLSYLPSTSFPIRFNNPMSDMIYLLNRVCKNSEIAEVFWLKLRDFVNNETEYDFIIRFLDNLLCLSTLKPLLSHVDIGQRTLQRLYRASVGHPQRAIEVLLDDILLALVDTQPRSLGAAKPLAEFVERLAREICVPELARWVSENVSPVQLKELRQMLDRENPSPRPDYVLIDIPAVQPERIQSWYFDSNNKFRAPGKEVLLDSLGYDLQKAIQEIIDDAETWAAVLCIELFVPSSMLGCNPDQWQVSFHDVTASLGGLHPVHLRWRERACGEPKSGRKLWELVAERLRADGGATEVFWIADCEKNGELLMDNIQSKRCGNCVGFLFIPFDQTISEPHETLRFALRGGLSFGFWLRHDPNDWCMFQNQMNSILGDTLLEDVPMRIKRARVEGQVQELTLFWDDPRRNPWENANLSTPSQRN